MKSLLVLLLAAHASAKTAGHVTAELYTDGSRSALRLVHQEHWHTYWSNPGDSGLATKISEGKILWPAPERIVAGPLTSFGYSGDAWLPVEGTPKKLSVKWLECADVCIPGKAELAAKAERHEAIAEAFDRLPASGTALGAFRKGNSVILAIDGAHPSAEFFPEEAGVFEGARGAVEVSPSRTELASALAPGSQAPRRLSGVLVRPGQAPVRVDVPVGARGAAGRALLLAFLGGILLNLMPCVFPVLVFKVAGLVQKPGRGHALSYSAGVVASFLALAGGLIAARAAGASVGWGFQLQNPFVVGGLALLFAGIGLNLLGLFEVGTRLMSAVGTAGENSSFWSGVFAVVVAAPCTAPFMGAALGWALTQPAPLALSVFASLGLGTAAPYAVLSSWPALLKRLPKPGSWMETFKHIMSIPMFLTSAWLLWVLFRLLTVSASADPLWKTWTPEAVAEARAAGENVFVDFTAAWCLSCQVNERVVLSRPEIRAALGKGSAFKADWTDKNEAIEKELAAHGRAGVPLYIVYPKGGEPVLLPEILTPSLVLDALGEKK